MKKKLLLTFLSMSVLAISAVTLLSAPTDFVPGYSQQKPYSFVLNSSNIGFLPSTAGTGQSDVNNSPRTQYGNPIIFAYGSAFKSGSRIRLVKNSGYICNFSQFSGLSAITIDISSGKANLSYGSSYSNYSSTIEVTDGMRYEISSMPYFKVSSIGSSTTYINSITVEYLCDGSGELDPVKPHVHNGYHYLATEPTTTEPGNLEFYACSECEYVSLVKEDEGTYVDTTLTYALPSDHIAYLYPSLLKKPAQLDYPIAVNLIVPSSGYMADQTGTSDASATIQSALNYVSSLGGGTVYVSSGRYLLQNQITIPDRVTLVGEFNGTDADDYGTVFLCTKAHDGTTSIRNNAQIIVSTNAGINGVTFYYPNQNINNVTEYGYTVYCLNDLTATVANLFFINSYNGITANDASEGASELVGMENLYGTFLHRGVAGYYQSDAASWNNIHISPSYYANALSGYRCSNSAALYKYTRTHLIALTLGDLDDFSLDKIYIDNAYIGIYFPTEVRRELQAFWGSLNDVHISDCPTAGVYAERLFSGAGVLFTSSSLGKIINNSDTGVLKLAKCEYEELLGCGNNMIEIGSETYEASPSHDFSHTFTVPGKAYLIDGLDDTGVADVSSALQTELNKITNGGVAVLKNGTYRLDNPVTLPDNTMLTSFSNTFARSITNEAKSYLVKLISYSDDACIKLGENSGINGLRIYNVYKDPDTAYNKLSTSTSDSYVAVKALGDGAFAINSEVTFTFTAFDFSNSSDHYIKHCCGNAYETFIKASGSGKVISSLTNYNFLSRSCLYQFAKDNAAAIEKYFDVESPSKEAECSKVRDDVMRTYTTMIKVYGGTEDVISSFSYGVKTLIECNNANVLAINTSQDYLKDSSYMYILNGGDMKIVNSLRVFGNSFNRVSGHLEAYGRLDFKNKFEKYYNSNSSSSDDPASPLDGLTESVLNYCENTSGVGDASRNSTYKKQGSYSWRASSQVNPAISYTFTGSPRDISSYMRHGYLRFYIYITSNKGSDCTVELTSGGTCDSDEITINISDQIKYTGTWNEIIIKLSDMNNGPGTFNPNSLNYFRYYALGASGYCYIDYISFFYKSTAANEFIINSCENTTDSWGCVSLDSYRVEGSYSWKPNDSVNCTFAYTIPSVNISSYMASGYLSFYLYAIDRTLAGEVVYVELTSGGKWDTEEITCNVKTYLNDDGWIHVKIPLSSFYASGSGTFDATRLNFFRLYTLNTSTSLYLDDIRLVK